MRIFKARMRQNDYQGAEQERTKCKRKDYQGAEQERNGCRAVGEAVV